MFKTIAVIALAALSTNAFAQNAATANATASATIVCPIAMADAGTGLAFGNIVQGAGDVYVNPAAAPTRAFSNANMYPGAGNLGTFSAAHFILTGASGFTYAISGPSTVTVTDGSTTATSTLVDSKSTGSLVGTGCAATDDFYVGGTLSLTALNLPGLYTGTFTRTVTYN